MAIIVTPSPDIQLGNAERLTIAKLNRLAKTTFSVAGTIAASEISAGAVLASKTKAGPHFYAATCTLAAGVYTLTWGTNLGPDSLAAGLLVVFKADAACAGPTDLDAGVSGAKNLLKNTGGTASDSELMANDVVANEIVAARYDGTNWRILWRLPSQDPASTPAGTAQDLGIYRHDATVSLMTYAWTSMVLRSAAGVYLTIGAKTGSLDAAAAGGIDQLDVGALAVGWYNIWAVSNGASHGAVLSLEANATPDSGIVAVYPYLAKVGTIYATVASPSQAVREFVQRGNRSWISTKTAFTAKAGVITNFAILSGADLTEFQKACPPNAKTVVGVLGTDSNNDCVASIAACNSDGSVQLTSPVARQNIIVGKAGASLSTMYAAGNFEVPVRGIGAGRNLQWLTQSAGTTYRLEINGYTI